MASIAMLDTQRVSYLGDEEGQHHHFGSWKPYLYLSIPHLFKKRKDFDVEVFRISTFGPDQKLIAHLLKSNTCPKNSLVCIEVLYHLSMQYPLT